MSDMPLSYSQTSPRSARLSPALLGLLATGAGLSAANLYYSQPLLGILASTLPASAADVGLIPTLTQLGYAVGLLLLAPLGDRFDRRRIILAKLGILLLALLGASLAPGLHALLLASLVTGLAATVAQDLIPAAATLAPPAERGRIVGTVMTGLLLGILLSRVVSGLVGELFGWRTLYLVAAASIAAIGVAVWRGLPSFAATTQLSYPALLGSLGSLWRRHAALRRATLAQGLLAVGFSAFWSTLALYLQAAPFQLGSAAAGAFGLAGAAGALAAPWAGRLADRHGSEWVTRLGIGLAALAFASLLALPWLPGVAGLVLLAVATVVFDLGVQASLIAHQAQVYGLEPEARSRLNAVLFTGMFIGMASGAALGSLLLVRLGWSGVAGLALTAALLALLVRLWPAAARRT
ncbi:MFS transporter [Pseudomonas oryzihabitans]|uniref:MFS transporter n=1 Tax=Pseudomonas oryzihabitans TaxID=47885 RepID=UPI002866A9B4|nr:MFS transporter [Pseudomonas psychrotolerans]MDR6678719.1 putative MFS family arabinose efflux permease [Pseudomonas psychrotolerans]